MYPSYPAGKKAYFDNLVEDLKDARRLWRKLKNLGLNIKNETEYISEGCNIFNEFFYQSPSCIDKTLKQETIRKLANSGENKNKNDTFYFSCVSPIEVHQAIKKVKGSAIGPDSISKEFIEMV